MNRENVNKIRKSIETYRKQGITDPFELEMKIANNTAELYDNYSTIVKKISRNENIDLLYKMLDSLDEVDKGKQSLAAVEYSLGEQLAKKYVYPNIKE